MSKNKIQNVISVLSSIAIVASNIAGLAAQASQKEAKHISISHTHEATGNTSYFHSHDEDEDCDCELDGTGNGTTIALLDAGVTGFDTYKQVSFVNDETIGSDHGDKMMSILHSKVPDAIILDVRVLDDEGKGKYSDVCKGIKWAVDNDADIIVMSFAGESNSSLLWDAVEYAEKNNVFVVASAGNTYGEKEMYPAAFNNVISVGAIDEEGLIRDFSNFGKNVDTYSENSDGTSGAAQFIAAEAAITLQNFSDVDAAELREEFQLNEKAVVTRASEENADELVYAAARCSHTYRWVTTRQPSCTAAGSKSYKCSKCGYVLNTSSIAKLGHNLEGWRTTITATCKSQGKKIRACRRYGCNYQESQTIPKTSHTYSWVTTRQPSCTVAGSKSYKCSKCGYVLNTSSIAKLGHNLEGWRTTITATCKSQGKKIRACRRYGCNYQESQTIPKTSHTYSWVTTRQPSCTVAGSKSYKCSKCGAVSTTSSIAKLGHNLEGWRTTKTATCSATGKKIRACKRYGCNYQESQDIPKIAHTYSWVTTKQPTCTAAGSKSYKCSKCGYVSTTSSITKLGHDYEDWRVTKDSTCTATGTKTRVCKRYGCHNQETLTIDKKPHTYSWVTTKQPTCTAAGSKSYKCSKCGYSSKTDSIDKLGHDYEDWRVTKDSTCTATGTKTRVCKRYGCHNQETLTIDKKPHTYSWVTTKQPTCTAAGSKSYKCSKCGYSSKTDSIDKLGHDYEDWRVTKDSTCTATGTKTRVCKRYGCHNQETLTIDKKPHTYSWVTTKQPTCTAAGSKSYKCSKCGYSSKTDTVAKLGHDYEDWRVTKAPTATTEGIETRTCKRYGCHNQETRKIQPTSYKEFGTKEYFEDLEKRTEDQAESSIIIVDYYTRKAENMMKDFEAYEKYMNMNDIPEDRWNAFCNEFSECVIGAGYVTEEMHYFRNKLNRAPATLNELLAEKEKWELLSVLGSLYHMYNTAASEEGEYNLKFISKDGHHEAVYNKDGILLTQYNDPDNMGTFNYVGPNESVLDHKTYDVNTYDNWGNVKGGKIASAADLADAFARYEANQRAQRHRGEIEAILENRESYKGAYKVTGNFSFHVAFSLSDSEENDHIVSGGNVGDSYLISQGTVLVLDYAGVCTQGVDSVTGKSYVNFDFLPYIGTNLVKMY